MAGFSSWTDVSGAALSLSVVLSGSVQSIYATSDGTYSISNYESGQYIAVSGMYRVVATITA